MSRIPVFSRASQDSPLPKQVGIVVNPLSNHASSAISEIVRQCRDSHVPTPRSYTTTSADPGSGQARQALGEGAELVIAIGGDGTVREVADSLAGTQARLGIIALGTGNVLASNLGLTRLTIPEQVATALRGPHACLDLGRAHLRTTGGDEYCEPFLTMAGIGRDALTVQRTGMIAKKRTGWAAYAISGMMEALRPPIGMDVQLDDRPPASMRYWTVLAGNTPAVLGGVLVYPGALVDDGRLEVLQVPLTRPDQWLPVAIKGLTGHDRPVAALRYTSATRLRVRPHHPLPVQVDGDVVEDVTELDVSVRECCVQVQLPPTAETKTEQSLARHPSSQ